MTTLRLGVNGLGRNTLAAPAVQLPAIGGLPQPIVTYLRHRILDPVTGVVLIDPLPTVHRAKWNVNFLQPGATGSVAAGTFDIPLPEPLSDEYIKYKAIFDILAEG